MKLRPTSPSLITLAVLLVAAASAQIGGSYVKAAIAGPASAAPGKAFDLVIRLSIQDGYHIQAADAKDPYIPTKVTVKAPEGYRVGAPVFPPSTTAEVAGEKLAVYEGRADVRVPITPPVSAVGKATVKATVSYQACNATSCFPPSEAEAEGSVTLAASPKSGDAAEGGPAQYAATGSGGPEPPPVKELGAGGSTGYVSVSARAPQGIVSDKPFNLVVALAIRPGYHIQAHEPAAGYIPTDVMVTATPGIRIGKPAYPEPTTAGVAGQRIPVYEGTVSVNVPVSPSSNAAGARSFKVKVRYQACNATSCFPPAETSVTISGSGAARQKPQAAAAASKPTGPIEPAGFAASRIEQFVGPKAFVGFLKGGLQEAGGGTLETLLKRSIWLALPLIFVLGLALNLTPCVYPIIPITISYFGGQAAKQGQKPLTLAIFYVLGMAVMYSALGVAAGMTGSLFGSQLQNPWVLAVFAVVMFALALSQFDRKDGRPIWELQLPAGLRNRATSRSGVVGAMLMGLLVGVVAAPCIGPAVVALLQWVSTQRSPSLGFASFFTLALGLGAPYILLATVSGSVKKLPRSGEWMIGVKHIFGVVLVWMGVYYLQTILNGLKPGLGQIALVAATALGGIYMLLDRSGVQARAFTGFRRALGVAALAAAVWLAMPAPAEAIRWQPYSDAAVERARALNKIVLVDFTASWCAACKELEHKTFSDSAVGSAARDFVALRADMTNWEGPESQKLKDRYRIVGLPTVIRLAPTAESVAER